MVMGVRLRNILHSGTNCTNLIIISSNILFLESESLLLESYAEKRNFECQFYYRGKTCCQYYYLSSWRHIPAHGKIECKVL